MKIEIKHRCTGSVLFELEIGSIKLAVEAAVKGGAYLSGAYIEKSKTKINWESHDLVAEILRRAAGEDIERLKIAGLLLICRSWCWDKFIAIDDPLKEWAFSELRGWVLDGDNAPEVLKKAEVPA